MYDPTKAIWHLNWTSEHFDKTLADLEPIQTKLCSIPVEPLTIDEQYSLISKLSTLAGLAMMLHDDIERLDKEQKANLPFWKKPFKR